MKSFDETFWSKTSAVTSISSKILIIHLTGYLNNSRLFSLE